MRSPTRFLALVLTSLGVLTAPASELPPSFGGGLIKTGTGLLHIGSGGVVYDPGILPPISLNQPLTYAGATYTLPDPRQEVRLGAAHDFEQFRNPGIIIINPIIYRPRPATSFPTAAADFPSENLAPRALVAMPDGTLYGVVREGGAEQSGQIVKIQPGLGANGSALVTTAASITPLTDGGPAGDVLVPDGAGRLLGVTRSGGLHGKGAIFRFNPADHSLTAIFDFPATLPGVVNGLAVGTDGTIYGISSALADTGTALLPSAYGGGSLNDYAALASVGSIIPAHGSVFKVSANGATWEVLKSFDAGEASVPGSLPTFGVGYFEPAGEAARTFFPCSIAVTNTKLYTWVSGGFHEIDLGSNNARWLLPTAKVEVPGNNSMIGSIFSEERFFGVATDISVNGSTIVFTNEMPPLYLQGGTHLYAARSTLELAQDRTTFFRTTRTSGTLGSGIGGLISPLLGRTVAGAPGIDSNAVFRIEQYPFGGSALVHQDAAGLRTLVDFERLVCIAPIPTAVGPAKAAVVAMRRIGDSVVGPYLFIVDANRNDPPSVIDFDARGLISGTGRLSYDPIPIPPSVGDPNGDMFNLTTATAGAHGTGSIYEDPNISGRLKLRYIRNYTLNGQTPVVAPVIPHDSFTYTMADVRGASATGTIQIGNEFPSTQPDRATRIGIDESGNAIYSVRLLANDDDENNDPLGALIALAANDPIQISKSQDGNSVIFHVPPSVTTARTIAYAITDNFAMATGQVVVGNGVPEALNPTVLVTGLDPVSIPKASMVSDPDNDTLSFFIVTPPAHGLLAVQSDAFQYTPVAGFDGVDSFVCEVRDPFGGSVLTTVRLRDPIRFITGPQVALLENGTTVGGLLRATVNRNGRATLRLSAGGKFYTGVANVTSGGPVIVRLKAVDGSKIDVVLGINSEGNLSATLETGLFIGAFARPNPEAGVLTAGRYHVLFTSAPAPSGRTAFAIVRVTNTGTTQITGRAPNGQPWSFGGFAGANGSVPFYSALPVPNQVFSGLLAYQAGTGAFEGGAYWQRPSDTLPLAATGSRWTPSLTSGANLLGENRTDLNVAFSLPGLSGPQTGGLVINRNNTVVPRAGTEVFQNLVLHPRTGLLSGTLLWRGDLGPVPFTALLTSEPTGGAAVLIGAPVTGGFTLSPTAP
jgi:hypothetical protein